MKPYRLSYSRITDIYAILHCKFWNPEMPKYIPDLECHNFEKLWEVYFKPKITRCSPAKNIDFNVHHWDRTTKQIILMFDLHEIKWITCIWIFGCGQSCIGREEKLTNHDLIRIYREYKTIRTKHKIIYTKISMFEIYFRSSLFKSPIRIFFNNYIGFVNKVPCQQCVDKICITMRYLNCIHSKFQLTVHLLLYFTRISYS